MSLPHTEKTWLLLDQLVDDDPIRLRDVAWEQVSANAAAEERGYQRAITALQDRDRFVAWLMAEPEPTPTTANRLAADYLTAHARPNPGQEIPTDGTR